MPVVDSLMSTMRPSSMLVSRLMSSVRFASVVDASSDEAKQGGMSLLDLSMSHVGEARSQRELVDELERNGVLKSSAVRDAMLRLDRALFVPLQQDAAVYAEPYGNKPQKLHAPSGATLSTPHHHCVVAEAMAKFIEARAHNQSQNSLASFRALDLGCGTGYLTVLVAEIMADHGLISGEQFGQIVGTDAVPSLVEHAKEHAAKRCSSEGTGKALEFLNAFAEGSGKSVLDVENGTGFDLVHVGFAFPIDSELGLGLVNDALRPGGRLVASLLLPEEGAQELVAIDKGVDGELTKTILARNMHCQAQLNSTFDEVEAKKTRTERLEEVKHDLEAWRAKFESKNGHKPSRDDMMADEEASKLFTAFANLRRGAWDA